MNNGTNIGQVLLDDMAHMHSVILYKVSFMWKLSHYSDAIMSAVASQITSLTIVYSIAYSDADQRKLAFVRGIHRWPVNSPHKGPVTRKLFPFDDVIMCTNPTARIVVVSGLKQLCIHAITIILLLLQESLRRKVIKVPLVTLSDKYIPLGNVNGTPSTKHTILFSNQIMVNDRRHWALLFNGSMDY